ncbi:hypothetical protein IMCC26256_11936 [Actinobacteria bacterium IMCC26256]|nr:hypothetical protein IMCC26256_11936 [Actinobacteria bacterium IMCC26256]
MLDETSLPTIGCMENGEATTSDTSGFDTGPGPRKAAFFIAYGLTVLSGVLGAVIGYGVAGVQCDVMRSSDCAASQAIGALIGGAFCAIGVGIVAVLTLRAMAEWRRPRS